MRSTATPKPITGTMLLLGLLGLCLGTILSSSRASATVDDPIDAGDVVLVDANDPSTQLDRGDGTTAFLVRVPSGATCPGDSLHDQWRIQSFMVPSTATIETLQYGVVGPEGDRQFALFGADFAARSYSNILTPANAGPGQRGRIETPPAFSFAAVAEVAVQRGDYRIGLACTYFGATAMFWDAEIVITAAADNDPENLRWRLKGAPERAPQPQTSNDAWSTALVALAAGGVLVVSSVWWARRRRTPTLKENR